MERWIVVALVMVAVTVGVLGQAWVSWLQHRRRMRTMDLIQASLDAGREPSEHLYDEIAHDRSGAAPPVAEVVIFSALATGFWIAWFNAEGDERVPFLSVAAAMTITAVGSLLLVILRLLRQRDGKG